MNLAFSFFGGFLLPIGGIDDLAVILEQNDVDAFFVVLAQF